VRHQRCHLKRQCHKSGPGESELHYTPTSALPCVSTRNCLLCADEGTSSSKVEAVFASWRRPCCIPVMGSARFKSGILFLRANRSKKPPLFFSCFNSLQLADAGVCMVPANCSALHEAASAVCTLLIGWCICCKQNL